MAVITLIFTESATQTVAGIPKNITIEANIPSMIFYTFDGTTPTTLSALYVGPITLPTNNSSVNIKVYATNGTDESAVISETYSNDISQMRRPHAGTTDSAVDRAYEDRFPFGSYSPNVNVHYNSSGGGVIDDPAIANINDGYDGEGGLVGGTDDILENYEVIYSETNRIGEYARGIGTLPGTISIKVPESQTVTSSPNSWDKFFNPKSLVIYQDSSQTPYDPNISQLNKQYFYSNKSSDGAFQRNTGGESGGITGGFIRSQYNHQDQTMTYYYRDQESGRWIISREKFAPTNPNIGNLSTIVMSRNSGCGLVFKWIPFLSRHLI